MTLMSEPEPDALELASIAPIVIIGIAVEPGQPGKLGYVLHEQNLAAIVENGAVHDLLKTISMLLDNPSIMKAVQDQDLMDRMGVQ